MIFTGKVVSGLEAAHIGLAEYGVEQNDEGDAAYQRALSLAEEILPQGPVAVKMAKLAINRGMQVIPQNNHSTFMNSLFISIIEVSQTKTIYFSYDN